MQTPNLHLKFSVRFLKPVRRNVFYGVYDFLPDRSAIQCSSLVLPALQTQCSTAHSTAANCFDCLPNLTNFSLPLNRCQRAEIVPIKLFIAGGNYFFNRQICEQQINRERMIGPTRSITTLTIKVEVLHYHRSKSTHKDGSQLQIGNGVVQSS